jgi:hypothetical protein
LKTLEIVETQQQVDTFTFHDGERALHKQILFWIRITTELDGCRMNATKNLCRANTTGDARKARIAQVHNATFFRTLWAN